MAARQSSGYSKLAAASTAKSTAPDWVWSENRKLLPTFIHEIQAFCGREFTLDAAANDNRNNDLCANFCSPSNSFMSKEHTWSHLDQCAFHSADYVCAALLVLQATVT